MHHPIQWVPQDNEQWIRCYLSLFEREPGDELAVLSALRRIYTLLLVIWNVLMIEVLCFTHELLFQSRVDPPT